jgi:hypothetical protein
MIARVLCLILLAGSAGAETGFTFWAMMRSSPASLEQPLNEKGTAYTSQQVAFFARLRRRAWIYCVQFYDHDVPQYLYRSQKAEAPDHAIRLQPHEWEPLDVHKGNEYVYVVASRTRLDDAAVKRAVGTPILRSPDETTSYDGKGVIVWIDKGVEGGQAGQEIYKVHGQGDVAVYRFGFQHF